MGTASYRPTRSYLLPPVFCLLTVAAASGCSRCDRSEGSPPGAAPLLLADAGSGPCPHPFFPLVEGAAWLYELGEGPREGRTKGRLEVVEVETVGSGQRAKIRRTVGPAESTVEVACGSDGASVLGAFVPLGPPLPIALEATPRPTDRQGALIPRASKLAAGLEWQYALTVRTELRGRRPLTMDSLWNVGGEWLRERTVEVPAGRFEAVQLGLTVSVHHRPPEEEDVVISDRMMDPPPMGFTYSLARGVGVVLIEGEPLPDRPGPRARWELTGVELPVAATR